MARLEGKGTVAAEIARIKQAWLAEWTALLNSDEVPINTYRVIGELEHNLMIGAKLARPGKFCLNFMGDGAFGMSGLDIETAGRIGAPITTVLLNNADMATYPGGYPVAREKFAVTRMTCDYAKIAEGLGAVGIVVKAPAEIAPALGRAQTLNKEGQPVLIDVRSNMEARRSGFDQGGG
jgi:acetolactate synthase-1/2/3 large subunit